MNSILKNVSCIALCICIAFATQSCVVTAKTKPVNSSRKPLPPGQAKKVDGSQSAKEYAPGQQKKKK
jgi:hypothetical protein